VGIGKPAVFAFYSSPTRAWEFAVGAVLALAGPLLSRVPRLPAAVAGAAGVAALLASGLVINASTQFPGIATLLPVGGTALLIASGTAAQGPLVRALSSRPLVWIGDRSYSWYLWHWPFIVFAAGLVPVSVVSGVAAAGVSLIPAALSYRYVEQPIRTSRVIRGKRMTALFATAIAVPAVICAGVVVWAPSPESPDTAAMVAQVMPSHLSTHCADIEPDAVGFDAACTWNPAAPSAPIYLVGDSQAHMLSEAVVTAAIGLDRKVIISSRGDCPFADINVFNDGSLNAPCREQVRQMLNRMLKTPGIAVIASGEFTV
jgi:hypothetical protein